METSIRRGTAVLVGLALVVAWVWCAAGTSWAGGPTSVLMVNPGTGQAAALHTTDARYEKLVETVRAYYPPTGSTTRPASVTDCAGCEVRLTWLIHDMRIWRVDRVHLTPDDGIWLESVSDETGRRDLLEQQAVWQRPHDSQALLALLRATEVAPAAGDVPGNVQQDPESSGQPPASDDGASTGETSLAAASGGNPDAPLGLVAVISGVAGMVVGLVAYRLVQGRHPDRRRVVLSD